MISINIMLPCQRMLIMLPKMRLTRNALPRNSLFTVERLAIKRTFKVIVNVIVPMVAINVAIRIL